MDGVVGSWREQSFPAPQSAEQVTDLNKIQVVSDHAFPRVVPEAIFPELGLTPAASIDDDPLGPGLQNSIQTLNESTSRDVCGALPSSEQALDRREGNAIGDNFSHRRHGGARADRTPGLRVVWSRLIVRHVGIFRVSEGKYKGSARKRWSTSVVKTDFMC